jgi:outer membrane protein assembly factor BamB
MTVVRLLLVCVLVWGHASPALAYLKFALNVGDRVVSVRWPGRVRYFVRDAGVPGVSADQVEAAVRRAGRTWEAVSTASIGFDEAGLTPAPPFESDGLSVVGFLDQPDLDRVLGATVFTVDTATGNLIEADIFFNASFEWSVAPGGEPGRFDLESVAVHELGHLSGLGHSMLGETTLRPDGGRHVQAAETVMFPVAFDAGSIEGRTLRPDDVAGLSDLYPSGDFTSRTGSLAGRVLGADGLGRLGAHVAALSVSSGTLVANFSVNDQGEFVVAGLEPGAYVVRVEPIDDADVESFFDPVGIVDLDFRATFHDRVVVVPRGGASARADIRVAPR